MKISIIICAFNSAKCLPKTLDFILVQDYSDYEVLVVDGKSTDGTQKIISGYEKKFGGKLRWISEEDAGVYEAMNKGVKMANGEYLNIIGAGDWLEAGTLKKVFEAIKRSPEADVIYGKTRIWDKDKKDNKMVQTPPDILPSQPMQHPAIFYKKTLHDRFGLYDESYKIAADYLFCLKAFYFGKSTIMPIDDVTNNFVMDGISSVNARECEKENKRIRKELGIRLPLKIINPIRFIKKRMKFLK